MSDSSEDEPQFEEVEFTPVNPRVKFMVSGGVDGSFVAEVFLDRVPLTASNFLDLCSSNFYVGLHFHRVIKEFMAQFGCPHSEDPVNRHQLAGTGNAPEGTFRNPRTGESYCRLSGGFIPDEFVSEDSNEPGTLSMANTGDADSGSSQFFLNVAHNEKLDWFSSGDSRHPVFGQIIEGYDTLKQISEVATAGDNPIVPIRVDATIVSGL
jgi:cyclophilin family peptidyl-prolyl cis-trans isomerase